MEKETRYVGVKETLSYGLANAGQVFGYNLIGHRRRQPAKDIRHPLQQEDLERTASEQLGSRRPQRRTEKTMQPLTHGPA